MRDWLLQQQHAWSCDTVSVVGCVWACHTSAQACGIPQPSGTFLPSKWTYYIEKNYHHEHQLTWRLLVFACLCSSRSVHAGEQTRSCGRRARRRCPRRPRWRGPCRCARQWSTMSTSGAPMSATCRPVICPGRLSSRAPASYSFGLTFLWVRLSCCLSLQASDYNGLAPASVKRRARLQCHTSVTCNAGRMHGCGPCTMWQPKSSCIDLCSLLSIGPF